MSLSHNNILQHAQQWACFHMKKHLVVTLLETFFHMCKSGQLHLNLTWVVPFKSIGMNVRRVASIWRIMMNLHDIKMKDISNVFFDTISGVSKNAVFQHTTNYN